MKQQIYGRTSPLRRQSPSPSFPCVNDADVITMEPFSKEDEKNTIHIVDEELKTATCYDRDSLLQWLVGTPKDPKVPLVEWVDMKDEMGHGGKPTNYPVFKLPDGYIYIDLPAVRALFYPETNTFYLEKVREKVAIGNAEGVFGISQFHGQEKVDVYTLHPDFDSLDKEHKGILEVANILFEEFKVASRERAIPVRDLINELARTCDEFGVLISMKTMIDINKTPFDSSLQISCRPSSKIWPNKQEREAVFMSGVWYICVIRILKLVSLAFGVNSITFNEQPRGMYYEIHFKPPLRQPFGSIGPILPSFHTPRLVFYSPSVNSIMNTLYDLFRRFPDWIQVKNYSIEEQATGIVLFEFFPSEVAPSGASRIKSHSV